MADLSGLSVVKKLWFLVCLTFWAKSAWGIAQSAKNQDIHTIVDLRKRIWKIAPDWATTPFLRKMFSNPAFCGLVGLRICQWCFGPRQTERHGQGQLKNHLIKVTFSINGSPGAESGAWIRLDQSHYYELRNKLLGIEVSSSDSAHHIVIRWIGRNSQTIDTTPINRRLITGGQLMDILNPKKLEVRDCNGQVIWQPPTSPN
ncbi:MAG: hypothetical protein WC400_02660 [Patescibacteria group bacterium]|jgi:hypothetical protein